MNTITVHLNILGGSVFKLMFLQKQIMHLCAAPRPIKVIIVIVVFIVVVVDIVVSVNRFKTLSIGNMEEREQDSSKSSHTYDHARTSNTLPTTTPGHLI